MPFSSVLGASSVIKPGVCTSTTRPSVPYEGQLIYETDTDMVASYNGSAWVYTAGSGLVMLRTVSFTNATDSGTNFRSIFNSTYNAYKIVCTNMAAPNNNVEPRVSFLYGTSTEQTSTYYSSVVNATYLATTSVTAVNNGAYCALAAKMPDSATTNTFTMDIYRAGVVAGDRMTYTIQCVDGYSGNFSSGGGFNTTSRTYDGLRFFASAGNISMTATVYGYRTA